MAGLASYIFGSMKNGGLHDYSHAAQIFRSSNYTRAPKEKWMFQVNFILDSQNNTFDLSPAELSYLVKSVELPKFTMDTKHMNQYNRKTWVQNRIKYEPVTIKFHDDNINGLREFWRSYYTYYFTDGNYQQNTYALDDRYTDSNSPSWGLDSGTEGPFLSAIEIYSLHGGVSNLITLMNPVITSFNHDSHDYSQTQEFMEATMQLHYTGVTYSQGYAAGIAGFGDPAGYDTTPSDISGMYNGYVIDPSTGNLIQANGQFLNPGIPVNARRNIGGFYNPTSKNGLTSAEISSILRNQNIQLDQFGFPVANTQLPTYSQNTTYIGPGSATAISNGQLLNSNGIISYPPGTVQDYLAQMGYNQAQISYATKQSPLVTIATAVGTSLLTSAIKSLLGGGKGGSNSIAKSLFGSTDASPALATSDTDNNAIDTTKTNVPMPQAKSASPNDPYAPGGYENGTGNNLGGTPIVKADYNNKTFQSNQNIKNYESGYSGGAGRGGGDGLPQGVNSPYGVSGIATTKSEQLGKQIIGIDGKQAQLDSQVASGQISDSIYEQKSAALAAQRSDLTTQQNIAQIHEAQILEQKVTPDAYAEAQDTAAAEAKAWDTADLPPNTVVPGSTEDPYFNNGGNGGTYIAPYLYDQESGLTYPNPDYQPANNNPYDQTPTTPQDWNDPNQNPYSAQNTPDTAEYEPYTSDYSSANEYTPTDDYNVE